MMKNKRKVQKHLSSNSSSYIKTKKDAIRYKRAQGKELISELSNNVSRWFLLWVVSLINWIITDLLGDFWEWLWTKIRSLFEGIFRLGFGADDDVDFEERVN